MPEAPSLSRDASLKPLTGSLPFLAFGWGRRRKRQVGSDFRLSGSMTRQLHLHTAYYQDAGVPWPSIAQRSSTTIKVELTAILQCATHSSDMNILIACEFSGIVREAFTLLGHNAWSCDLLPSERPGQHIQGNVLDILEDDWDMMIAHPPCTYLARSGARWWPNRQQEQADALDFVRQLLTAPINRIALENPISVISTTIRKPDQIIQPWMFGHGETKATCLWLKNLPHLVPTDQVTGRNPRVHTMPRTKDRWKNRSRTMQGIANAMALQWTRTS